MAIRLTEPPRSTSLLVQVTVLSAGLVLTTGCAHRKYGDPPTCGPCCHGDGDDCGPARVAEPPEPDREGETGETGEGEAGGDSSAEQQGEGESAAASAADPPAETGGEGEQEAAAGEDDGAGADE